MEEREVHIDINLHTGSSAQAGYGPTDLYSSTMCILMQTMNRGNNGYEYDHDSTSLMCIKI